MGNCLTARSRRAGAAPEPQPHVAADAAAAEEAGSGPALKVKLVLTRAELEWLTARLKSGEKRLEEVLEEMGRERAAAAAAAACGGGWRPSLECIVESPEA